STRPVTTPSSSGSFGRCACASTASRSSTSAAPSTNSRNPFMIVDELRGHVRAMYTQVAEAPGGEFHFEVGREVALRLGYPASLLNAVPEEAVASFAGVGQFFDLADIQPGERVLDLGSGSGTDSFIAASLGGSVVGVEMTAAQLAKARRVG